MTYGVWWVREQEEGPEKKEEKSNQSLEIKVSCPMEFCLVTEGEKGWEKNEKPNQSFELSSHV